MRIISTAEDIWVSVVRLLRTNEETGVVLRIVVGNVLVFNAKVVAFRISVLMGKGVFVEILNIWGFVTEEDQTALWGEKNTMFPCQWSKTEWFHGRRAVVRCGEWNHKLESGGHTWGLVLMCSLLITGGFIADPTDHSWVYCSPAVACVYLHEPVCILA